MSPSCRKRFRLEPGHRQQTAAAPGGFKRRLHDVVRFAGAADGDEQIALSAHMLIGL